MRALGQRHDGDVGHFSRLDHAALDEPAEVDDNRLSPEVVGHVLERLPRLQCGDAAGRERGLVAAS